MRFTLLVTKGILEKFFIYYHRGIQGESIIKVNIVDTEVVFDSYELIF